MDYATRKRQKRKVCERHPNVGVLIVGFLILYREERRIKFKI